MTRSYVPNVVLLPESLRFDVWEYEVMWSNLTRRKR